MSLFIGNVSKKVTQKQFQDAFKAFGKCKVDLRKRFAFVQYQSQRNAEQAKKQLQNANFSGLKLNIQWSKNSGRFNQNTKTKSGGRRKSRQRDRSWRKQDRYRRSPQHQKRSAPSYSDNQDFQNFIPRCSRDIELIRRLRINKQQGQLINQKRSISVERQRNPENDIKMKDQNQQENKSQQIGHKQKRKPQEQGQKMKDQSQNNPSKNDQEKQLGEA